MMEEYYFLTFASTNHALQAEAFLKEKGHSITVMPVPREVSASCGLSIKFNSDALDNIKKYIEDKEVKTEGIYCLKKESGKRKVTKIG